jgi:hypothetical protein
VFLYLLRALLLFPQLLITRLLLTLLLVTCLLVPLLLLALLLIACLLVALLLVPLLLIACLLVALLLVPLLLIACLLVALLLISLLLIALLLLLLTDLPGLFQYRRCLYQLRRNGEQHNGNKKHSSMSCLLTQDSNDLKNSALERHTFGHSCRLGVDGPAWVRVGIAAAEVP